MEISGVRMLIGLLAGIALLIVLMLRTKIQAFLALILCTIVVGVIGGMPLTATDIVNASGEAKSGVSIVNSIIGGFGGTLGNIGIIIGFGVMLGQIFAVSGAAKRMAYTFLKLFGKGKEEAALALTGLPGSHPDLLRLGLHCPFPDCQGAVPRDKEIRDRPGRGTGCRLGDNALSGSPDSRPAGCLRDLRY